MPTNTIKIGIEMRVMAGAMTGIGNYSFQLLQAMMRRDVRLHFSAFDLYSWKSVDAGVFERIAAVQTELHSRSARRLSLTAKSKRMLLNQVKQSEIALATYRMLFSQTVKSQGFDLFHAFNFIPFADPGVTTLPIVYDLSFVRYPDAHPQNRRKRLDALPAVLARAPLIQTISEFSRQEISSVYGISQERIFVAPPAASEIFRPAGAVVTGTDLEPLGLKAGGYLLAVGTLEPRKNLRTLIYAYAKIPMSDRAAYPLVIVGNTGWGQLELPAETAALVAEGSLIFLGSVSNAILRSLYEGAIALLFPSIYEGFGMPVSEAMACGTRVVHSSHTSMDEISGDLAVRVPALDVDAWAIAIQTMIAEVGQETEAVRAARVARALAFDWDTSAVRVARAYDVLLSR